MKIIPYVEFNGAWTLPDTFMSNMFESMKKEGTYKKVFHGGAVKNAEEFVRWMKNKAINAIVLIDDNADPLMLTWIANYEDKRAWFNFNVFKKAWGIKSKELMLASIKYYFDMIDNNGNPLFELLIGVTPVKYRLVVKLTKACGGIEAGIVPKFFTNYWTKQRMDAIFIYLLKSNFDG